MSRLDETTNLVPLNVKIEFRHRPWRRVRRAVQHGIKVGKVSRILFDANDPRIVYAVTQVKADTPIRDDTYATIDSQGLTGVAYISAQGRVACLTLAAARSSTIPVISASPRQ
ncbi:MAG: MlaD family protein [Nitratireductor sp.]